MSTKLSWCPLLFTVYCCICELTGSAVVWPSLALAEEEKAAAKQLVASAALSALEAELGRVATELQLDSDMGRTLVIAALNACPSQDIEAIEIVVVTSAKDGKDGVRHTSEIKGGNTGKLVIGVMRKHRDVSKDLAIVIYASSRNQHPVLVQKCFEPAKGKGWEDVTKKHVASP